MQIMTFMFLWKFVPFISSPSPLQTCFQGPRCQLLKEEGPCGADEHVGEQAVQDVQRLRLRLFQRQRQAHWGQQVQGLSKRSQRSSRCWNIKSPMIVRLKWKRDNSKVHFKALKSSIASKSNRHLYCFFENLYKHSRFYFLRKIQNCVLSFKALPCLMLWCYLFK